MRTSQGLELYKPSPEKGQRSNDVSLINICFVETLVTRELRLYRTIDDYYSCDSYKLLGSDTKCLFSTKVKMTSLKIYFRWASIDFSAGYFENTN